MKELLLELLFAVENVGTFEQGIEPGDIAGENYNEAALKCMKRLSKYADYSKASLQGAQAAAKLFLEATTATDIRKYARREIAKGLYGNRHGFEGAGRIVTVTIAARKKVKK